MIESRYEITVGIISIDQQRQIGYVYVTRNDPYWATNYEINLDTLERMFFCKFAVNGHLPRYIETTFYSWIEEDVKAMKEFKI